MTLEEVLPRLAEERDRLNGPVDIPTFAGTYFPHDVEVIGLLLAAFNARLVRGRMHSNMMKATGHISEITVPTWH